MAAKDSVDVIIAHSEQYSLLEDQVSESWIQVTSLAPVPLHPFPFGRNMAVFLRSFLDSPEDADVLDSIEVTLASVGAATI